MVRYRIDLAYDGGGFRGYARQNGLRTVQGEMESALSDVLGSSTTTVVAGRTDAGVHARGQVASFDHDDDLDLAKLMRSLNGILGPEIAVQEVSITESDFHARFSASCRRYLYRLDMSAAQDPLERHRVWHVGRDLDVPAMRRAMMPLLGEHDFSSFCRKIEGKTNVRNVTEARWEQSGDRLDFWVTANSFCKQMVRSFVGFSYDVGRGFTSAADAERVLAARDRATVVTVAPPHGLILWEVGY